MFLIEFLHFIALFYSRRSNQVVVTKSALFYKMIIDPGSRQFIESRKKIVLNEKKNVVLL